MAYSKPMKRDSRSGGWKGGQKAGGSKPWERREGGAGASQISHEARCGECNATCSVPFKPTGKRPVLCNKCFKKDGAPSDQKRSRAGANFGADRRPSFGDKRPYSKPAGSMGSDEFKILNAKLDAILRALTQ